MIKSKSSIVIVLTLAILSLASIAFAETDEKAKSVRVDKARYKKLQRDLKKIDAEFTKIRNEAVVQTKKEGVASLETQSKLKALIGKRDRCLNRVMLIALRHGGQYPA